MSVKARWTSATIEIDDSDPFADDEPPRVTTVGLPIDLNADTASLDQRLVESLSAESNLFNEGVTCAIKQETEGTSCHCCPLYQGDDLSTPHGRLCRVGREQQQIVTLLAIREHGGGR